MKKLKVIIVIIALLFSAAPTDVSARENNKSLKREKRDSKSKRSKKAIRNYTHTLPAEGARAQTRNVAKKYKKISKLALKNPYQKWQLRDK